MTTTDRLPPHSPQRIVLIEIEKQINPKKAEIIAALSGTLDQTQIQNALYNLQKAGRAVQDIDGRYTVTARGRECLRGETTKTKPEGAGLRVNDPAAGVPASEKLRASDLTAQLRKDNGHIEKTIEELERQVQHHEATINKLRNLITDLRQFTRTP